jgi:RNA polymerase sigma-70 factor (ECF subfamily)
VDYEGLLKNVTYGIVLRATMKGNGAQPDEIEALYRKRFRAFLLSATALLGDGESALDAVQEGFALAVRRRRTFRGDGNLEAWLWRIVINVARDHRRAQGRETSHLRLEPSVGATFESNHDEVRASLLALPERQRLAVFLRYYADLSYDGIAEALGVAPGTVAASLNAARNALRQRLQEVAR